MADIATQFPSTPEFAAVNFRVKTPSQITETNSGKIRRVGYGVSYYTCEAEYATLKPADAGKVQAFVAKCFGPQQSFEIVLPKISYSKATTQVSYAQATSVALAGAKYINVGCGAVNAGKTILMAGDFFKFNNHSKVYMCTDTIIADGSGNGTVYFSSSVVTNIPSGVYLTITSVPFTMVLDGDIQEWAVGNGGMTNMKLSMREVW